MKIQCQRCLAIVHDVVSLCDVTPLGGEGGGALPLSGRAMDGTVQAGP